MRILVVGSGGREHALCWKIAASPLVDTLYCAPGNAGIAAVAECVAIGAEDLDKLTQFAIDQTIDLVVVGPEAPLVKGLVDKLEAAGIRAFGPRKNAAEIEGSKGFMKDLAARHNIPTARYRRFLDADNAKIFARTLPLPVVVKADGLAAGKGVIICASHGEAEAAIESMMVGHQFGQAGDSVVVEEFLEGEELSFFALSDGTHVLPMVSAQDHKRVGDGDTGPNTGGMGAYSPAPVATPEIEARIMTEIIRPAITGLKSEGRAFKGVLFAGIMVTKDGPKLIEFNARFGDPECEVMCLRLMSDIVPALQACVDGTLEDFALRWYPDSAVTVVMATQGYPGSTKSGSVIRNIPEERDDATVFHCGTKRNAAGVIEAHGGRVLAVTALGKSVREAQAKAYELVDQIDWPEGFCRRDIAWRAIAREGK
ncbi:phosphoribosylamine--glycine ligase [Dongia deserti]|uniref:phosphoribosylamine--glycine ligase n=1 Tax=Dongia deserti TaxID=2268030 RepID=UPI000E64DF0A|nr:phosphoribosylamine--glycine ligase [Dongia deserti]